MGRSADRNSGGPLGRLGAAVSRCLSRGSGGSAPAGTPDRRRDPRAAGSRSPGWAGCPAGRRSSGPGPAGRVAPQGLLLADGWRALEVTGQHAASTPVRASGNEPGGCAKYRQEHDDEHPGGLREAAQIASGGDRNIDQAGHDETHCDQPKEYASEQHAGSLAAAAPGSWLNWPSIPDSYGQTVIGNIQ